MRPRGWRIGCWMLAAALVTTACAAGDTDSTDATDAAVDDTAPDAPSDDATDATTDADPDATSDDAGTEGDGVEAPSDDVAVEPDEPQPVDGPLAFSARSLEGGTVDVATFAGGAVALWMWTPW